MGANTSRPEASKQSYSEEMKLACLKANHNYSFNVNTTNMNRIYSQKIMTYWANKGYSADPYYESLSADPRDYTVGFLAVKQ